MPANTLHLSRAEDLARFLFPTSSASGLTDVRGNDWMGMTTAEAVERVAGFPQRTVAAFTKALHERHDRGLIDVAAKLALDWIRDHYANNEIDRGHSPQQLRDLGDFLPFLTVCDAVMNARPSGLQGPRLYMSHARQALLDTASLASAGLADLRIPASGAVGLPPKQLRSLRGYVLGWMLEYQGIAANSLVEARMMPLLEQHADAPEHLAAVVAARGTLDPDVLTAVLRSPTPALAEGAL